VAAFFLTDSAITLGGIQVSLLTGRILFKDLHYHCRDYAIRVTDGYASFHWWKRAGIGGCVCSGSSERKTALVLFQLNGFQLHWYNRSEVYDAWGKVHSQEAAHATEASDNSFVWSLWKKLQPSFHFKINKVQCVQMYSLSYIMRASNGYVIVGCWCAGTDGVWQSDGREEPCCVLPSGRGTLPHY
jgi:hypothetical protein